MSANTASIPTSAPSIGNAHPSRWEDRWSSNNIGWDQGAAHPALVALLSDRQDHGEEGRAGATGGEGKGTSGNKSDELGIARSGRALVPGCGMVCSAFISPLCYTYPLTGSECLDSASRHRGRREDRLALDHLDHKAHRRCLTLERCLSMRPQSRLFSFRLTPHDRELALRNWARLTCQGYDVALLASRGLDTTGLDIAPTGVQAARRYLSNIPTASSLSDKMRVEEADFFSFYTGYTFDVILDYTCVSSSLTMIDLCLLSISASPVRLRGSRACYGTAGSVRNGREAVRTIGLLLSL